MEKEKEQIVEALYKFIAQRPGMEPRNYGDYAGYRQELRQVTNDRHHAEKLLAAVKWRDSITADKLKEAMKRSFSGRLSWETKQQANRKTGEVRTVAALDYCTGQYFATEYRKAVCAVLASALWDYWWHNMPEPTILKPDGDNTPASLKVYGPDKLSAGDWLRKTARKEFGATIAGRYFR